MALKKTIDFKGITVDDAYIRVVLPTISEDKASMRAYLTSAVGAGAQEFDRIGFECPYDIEGENPIKQAYGYIKTLAPYAGAVDC